MNALPYLSDSTFWLESVRPLGCAVLLDSAHRTQGRKKPVSSPGAHGPDSGTRRYDIVTAAPETLTRVQDGLVQVRDMSSQSTVFRPAGELFAVLKEQMQRPAGTGSGPFSGGLLGFWGYELNHYLEPGRIQPRSGADPDLMVGLYLWAVVVDHHLQQTALFCHPDLPAAKKQTIVGLLDRAMAGGGRASDGDGVPFVLRQPFQPCWSRAAYNRAFASVQSAIAAGDCYQINLTQRFSARYEGDTLSAYRRLRALSPAPFSAYMDFPGLGILSHSPERLLFSQDGHVEARPIKGTRPRLASVAEDQASQDSLLASEKDRAENLMIVDLLRNDLARNCCPGSVRVPALFQLETYANVHHLVSTVTGRLAQGRSNLDLLEAVFPGGSITGAPKIRAMELIRELEPLPRSVYCGAIGYVSLHGRMDLSIPIRTLVATGEGEMHVWGGGGIVADSLCDDEYEESRVKVRNLMRGLEDRFLVRGAAVL